MTEFFGGMKERSGVSEIKFLKGQSDVWIINRGRFNN